MEEKYCQSCGMPMNGEAYGTEADGKTSEDYCSYCYQGGAFTSDTDMQGMIDICVPHMVSGGMPEAQARQLMEQSLPLLKRWT